MKKLAKLMLTVSLALVLVFALAACGPAEETYSGSYSYVAYGTTYSAHVDVVVKGDSIVSVTLKDTSYNLTTSWKDTTGGKAYTAGEAALLKAYAGKTVKDVNAIKVSLNGQNNATEDKVGDSTVLISGATQSSARILFAVQNALSKIEA